MSDIFHNIIQVMMAQ